METFAVSVKNILRREKHLNFSDEWFEACVDWIKENHPASQINANFLRDQVCTQWMDANLSELECKCLPANLVSQKYVSLPGHYALQVNIIEDIGESSYSQWNKLKKLENENTNISGADSNESKPSWEPKPRRCLYLTMTDGSQEVFGMELVTVSALNTEIKPGAKVLISGPIECRRGVMHLKPGNVRVLGGEVESLIEVNAFEKILQKRMAEQAGGANVDLPRPKYARPAGGASKKLKQVHGSQSSQASIHSRSTQPVHFNSSAATFPRVPSFASRGPSAVTRPQEPEPDPFGDDDEDFMDIDETLIMSQAQQANATTIVIPRSQVSSQSSSQGLRRVPSQNSYKERTEPVVVDLLDDDEDLLLAEASYIPPITPKRSKTSSRSPYQYIKTVQNKLNGLANGEIIYVKACVATLVSNISVQDGQWTLTVNLNDGSGFLEAKMDSELLNRIIGFSVPEMKKLKTDPSNRHKINQGLAQLTSTLVHMNGIFGVRRQGAFPVITTFQDIQSSHVQTLRNRLVL